MNSHLIKLLIIGLVSISIIGCGEPEETDLTIAYQLKFNDQALAAFDEIEYPLGYKVFFTKYSMYISDLKLKSDAGEVLLTDVDFIDLLTNVDAATAVSGITRTYTKVPTDNYTRLSFNIGIPTLTNATNPSDYTSTSPLANTGEYWEGWASYIFHKIEGKIDPDGDGVFDTGVALHIGSDQAFRSFSVDMPIQLKKADEKIDIIFDLNQVLNIDGNYFDFVATPQVHHLGVLPKVLPILDNTVAKIKVVEE